MNLQNILQDHGISQKSVADAIPLSPAALSLILRHGIYPKKPKPEVVNQDITNFLATKGIAPEITKNALASISANAVGCAVRTDTETHQSKQPEPKDELMLLKKQSLTPTAKKQFGVFTNPFTCDVACADALYMSPDVNYVRQALYQTARHGGFIAVTGESGSGKTTLRRDLIDRLQREKQPVIIIEPFVLATEDNDIKGKTMKSSHIAEAIINALAPLETPRRSTEARFRQVHNLLKESSHAGNSHVIVIEEAHSLPIPTLKHLKRFFELEDGYKKLLSIVLIGQNELALKLSEQNQQVREVVQRCEIVTLNPISDHELQNYLSKRADAANLTLGNIIDDSGIQAIADRLTQRDGTGKVTRSILYPLAVGNLLTGAMNLCAELGAPTVSRDVVMEA